ncbi:insulinase family protein [Kitasatospora indigofera]|uniref:insulinase family protein n=1 Tax=Kitasatospora indigofera TaxID=67307 RepID=UPI0036780926
MIHRFEVDGVPALFVQRPGRTSAGLAFRVGHADETLARHGTTHLVEHLALHRSGLAGHHLNASTDALHTQFRMEGTEPDAVSFLQGLCESLTTLPGHRLEAEKAVLRAEATARGTDIAQAMNRRRYGAQGHGLAGYPEWGLGGLTEHDVQEWADTWFTQGNAALWIAGERIPEGLRLPLYPGPAMPPPPTTALPDAPSYIASGHGQVVYDTVLPAGPSTSLYCSLLERELFRALRHDGGYSYSTTARFTRRGDGWGTLTAHADSQFEHQEALLGAFVDVLARFEAVGTSRSDLDLVRDLADQFLAEPAAEALLLPDHTADLLSGLPLRTVDERRAELSAVTPENIHLTARQGRASALLLVPAGRRAEWAGYTCPPTTPSPAVTGRRHPARTAGAPDLTIGQEGISLTDKLHTETVHYNACAALLAWPDGSRHMIGTDGTTLRFTAAAYALDAPTITAVDASVPPESVVHMPGPAPHPPSTPLPPRNAVPSNSRAQRVALLLLTLLAVLWGTVGALLALSYLDEPTNDPLEWTIAAIIWVSEAWLVKSVINRHRRRTTAPRHPAPPW